MGLAFIYPGQGNQHSTMFERFSDEPAARPALDAVSERLNTDVRCLAESVTPEQLQENRTAQLLMVGHALAISALLANEGLEPVVHVGYSVGELSAHGCAGALGIDLALDLAVARASCMDEAAANAGGELGMIALRGLSLAVAERIAGETGTAIALINGPEHVVLGGLSTGMEAVEEQAIRQGARLVKRLGVRVASHTAFLAAAAPCFEAVLQSASWQSPGVPVLSGIDGRPVRMQQDFQSLLAAQLHRRVNWSQCVESAVEHGATTFIEMGPGRSLTKMVEELQPHCAARAFEDFRSASGIAKWVRRQLAA